MEELTASQGGNSKEIEDKEQTIRLLEQKISSIQQNDKPSNTEQDKDDMVKFAMLAKEKAEKVKELKEKGLVMMCGDGINDSPALANADVGVSVKSGTDIAMDSSDVILTKNDLDSILKLIKISERTIKNIKQNLFWAFFYNCLMIPVAIGLLKPFGISINPMIASLAMLFSSFTVILNALRLKKKN